MSGAWELASRRMEMRWLEALFIVVSAGGCMRAAAYPAPVTAVSHSGGEKGIESVKKSVNIE